MTAVCCPRISDWWPHCSTTTIAVTRTAISTPAAAGSCASRGYAPSPPTTSAFRSWWPTATWSTAPRGVRPRAAGSGLLSMVREVSMVRQDENTKSVRFTEAVDGRLTLLARKLGRTKRELFMQMVDYFYKSKKDPADLNDEVLKKELSNGINRIL